MATAVVLINGLPGAGKTTLASQLARELGWPCVSKDAVKEALGQVAGGALSSGQLGAVAMDTAWLMASAMSGVVIVDSWWFRPRDLAFARAGVRTAGAALVLEVWCEVEPALAQRRYARRQRAPVHEDGKRLADDFEHWAAHAAPLGLGPVLRVDTSETVDLPAVAGAIRRGIVVPDPRM